MVLQGEGDLDGMAVSFMMSFCSYHLVETMGVIHLSQEFQVTHERRYIFSVNTSWKRLEFRSYESITEAQVHAAREGLSRWEPAISLRGKSRTFSYTTKRSLPRHGRRC